MDPVFIIQIVSILTGGATLIAFIWSFFSHLRKNKMINFLSRLEEKDREISELTENLKNHMKKQDEFNNNQIRIISDLRQLDHRTDRLEIKTDKLADFLIEMLGKSHE